MPAGTHLGEIGQHRQRPSCKDTIDVVSLANKVHKSYRLLIRRRRQGQLPAIPPGHVCAPPDFVGVGAQRAGSTWWDRLVAEHPDVHDGPGRLKEVHFFDRMHDSSGTTDQGSLEQRYARFFPHPEGLLSGEWTPRYLYDAWTVPLLRRAAPEAKILVILRDPVERYLSALTLQKQWGRRFDRSFLQHTFQRGLYAGQLDRLYDAYPADQILVLQFEECLKSIEPQLARTYRFLGLATDFVPTSPREARSKALIDKVQLSPEHLAWVRRGYHFDVRRLQQRLPELDLSLWRNVS